MKTNAPFSSRGIMLVFAVVGLLLGGAVAASLFQARSASAQGGAISADEAKAAAEAAYPGATAIEVEMDDDDGRNAYEVELDNGTEVIVDPANGAILGTETETGGEAEDDENEAEDEAEEADDGAEAVDEADAVAPSNTGITAAEAQAIAEAANPGVATLAVEFDRENGVDLFEVELDNGQDVRVDANTGAILGTKTRDAD